VFPTPKPYQDRYIIFILLLTSKLPSTTRFKGSGGRGGDGDRRYVKFSIILIMFIIIIISEQRGRNVGEDEE
jgi:hypothetical protein